MKLNKQLSLLLCGALMVSALGRMRRWEGLLLRLRKRLRLPVRLC